MVQLKSAQDPSLQPIVLLHGFTQNSACWGPFDTELASHTGRAVYAIDAPGHGGANSSLDSSDLWVTAGLMAETARQVAPSGAHWVGYSMGGRTALHLALEHPDSVVTLCTIGASPGLITQLERDERMRADAQLADHLVEIGLSKFLTEWLALPLFAGLSSDAAHIQHRLANRQSGLAASLRNCGTGNQDDLRSQLWKIACPSLILSGALDSKFTQLGAEIQQLIPRGELQVIQSAGHTAHLEQPAATASAIAKWLGLNAQTA